MDETSEVSEHLCRVFAFAKSNGGWVTAKQIATGAEVAQRTARAHALRLVQLGIFDQAEVFPSHRYRLSKLAAKRNRAFMQRLDQAGKVFGQ